jgi:hypothetical protein
VEGWGEGERRLMGIEEPGGLRSITQALLRRSEFDVHGPFCLFALGIGVYMSRRGSHLLPCLLQSSSVEQRVQNVTIRYE